MPPSPTTSSQSARFVQAVLLFYIKLFALLLVYHFGATASSAQSSLSVNSIPTFTINGSPVTIDSWLLVGPFPQSRSDDSFVLENDSGKAVEETPFVDSIDHASNPLAEFEDESQTATGEFLDFDDIFRIPHAKPAQSQVAYAICRLKASVDRRVYLMVGSSDSAAIWINGTEVRAGNESHGLATYNDVIPIDLRSGANTVVARVAHKMHATWGLTAHIELSPDAAIGLILEQQKAMPPQILERVVFNLRPGIRPVHLWGLEHEPFKVSLRNSHGEVLDSGYISSGQSEWLPKVPIAEGMYVFQLSFRDHDYQEPFCFGDPIEIGSTLLSKANRLVPNNPTVSVLQARLAALKKSKSGQKIKGWEAKIVSCLFDLNNIVTELEDHSALSNRSPGLHLRGFVSRIDGQVQSYRLFIPGGSIAASAPLPLAIICPTVTSSDRPFIESAFLSDQAEADKMGGLASKFKMAVVWCGYRTQPTGMPIELTHLDEVIQTVGQELNIDSKRIYLLGSCSGAAMAVNAIAHWPHRFAGAGFLNPVFGLRHVADRDATTMERFEPYNAWLRANSTVDQLFSQSGPPIFIIHDGGEPGHGSLSVAQAFQEEAALHGYPASLRQQPQTVAEHFGGWSDLFAWLSQQRASAPSSYSRPIFWGKVNSEWSIAHFLAEPFTVVYGTNGSADEQRSIKRIADEFRNAWQETNHCDCSVSSDTEYLSSAVKTRNVFLIGNSKTNAAWSRFAQAHDFNIDDTAVTVKGRRYAGADLEVLVAFPRTDTGPAAIFLGAQDAAQLLPPDLRLAVVGWYKQALWQVHDGKLGLLDIAASNSE